MNSEEANQFINNFEYFISLKYDTKYFYFDLFEDIRVINNSSFHYSESQLLNSDLVYHTQDVIAFKFIKSIRDKHSYFFKDLDDDVILDIGSRFLSAGFFGSIFKKGLIYAELFNEVDMETLNQKIIKCQAQSLPFDSNSLCFISSLHAIEHFGLGRYGDDIDFYGDIKGLKEMHRVLKPGGFIVTSIPCTFQNSVIKFHQQRVYNPSHFDKIMNEIGFEILNDKKLLDTINVASKSELEKNRLLRKDFKLFIIPAFNGLISWNKNDLVNADIEKEQYSAYLSVWRKKC